VNLLDQVRRVCVVDGCESATPSKRHRYCKPRGERAAKASKHNYARERARRRVRGTSEQRGYGSRHRTRRAAVAPLVAAGAVDCWRCGKRIEVGEPWDLGHSDADRSRYRGPEHAYCNRAAAARRRAMPSREW
jgi:hypothetical protein